MIRTLKRRIADSLLLAADVAGVFLSASGAAIVAFLGKLMLAVVLAAIALGFFLRIAGRKKLAAVAAPARLGLRYQLASGAAAAVEVALLVEATKLPVRFDQPGFEPWHWALVVAALCLAYPLNMRICRRLAGKAPRRQRGTMKVVAFEPQWWFLLEQDGALFLDVNCNHSFLGYPYMIELDAGERRQYAARGREFIEQLAQGIQDSVPILADSKSPFAGRDVSKLYSGQVDAAVQDWRASQA